MPYLPSKSCFKKSRFMKRRRGRRAPLMKTLRNRIPLHHFKRNFTLVPNGSVSATTDIRSIDTGTALSYFFSLSQIPNLSEFTSLFDAYRINKVILKLIPQITGSDKSFGEGSVAGVGTGLGRNPRVMYALDHDDDGIAFTLDQLRQFNTVRVRSVCGYKPIVIKLTPACSKTIYNGVTSAYVPVLKQWLDQSYPSVPHYGIKLFVEDCSGITSAGSTACIFKVEGTMYFSCKDVR